MEEPLIAQPATPRKWYEIWIDVWTHPGVDVYRRILREPGVKNSRAFTWVAVTAFIAYLINLLVYLIFLPAARSPIPNVNYTTFWLCLTLASPVLAILGIIIISAIYHWIAGMMGGKGSVESLVYCFAIVSSPLVIISVLFTALGQVLATATPVLTLCGSLLILPFSIYAIVLNVIAIDAVEGIGTGKSVLTYFIPVVLVAILVGCCVLVGSIAYFQTQ